MTRLLLWNCVFRCFLICIYEKSKQPPSSALLWYEAYNFIGMRSIHTLTLMIQSEPTLSSWSWTTHYGMWINWKDLSVLSRNSCGTYLSGSWSMSVSYSAINLKEYCLLSPTNNTNAYVSNIKDSWSSKFRWKLIETFKLNSLKTVYSPLTNHKVITVHCRLWVRPVIHTSCSSESSTICLVILDKSYHKLGITFIQLTMDSEPNKA